MMSDDLKLKIDAHVIRQLGAELISSPIVAITELIKNSHDADAKWCKLEIDSEYSEEFEVDPALYPKDKTLRLIEEETEENGEKTTKIRGFKTFKGRVLVSDDGHGMERETINKSWLTVSYSEKRNKKLEGLKTQLSRNYTGDKGLGRLGSMQVASICRITSFTLNNLGGINVTINWDQLIEGITVDQIKIDESTVKKSNPKSKGTVIELIGLADLNYWSYDLTKFKYEVAVNISPFDFFSKRKDVFSLYIKSNGIEQDANTLTKNLFDLSSGLYSIKFDRKKLTVNGQSTLLSFESQNTRELFKPYVLSDEGEELFSYFEKSKELGTFSLGKLTNSKYFIKWSKTIDYDEIFSDEKYKNILLENPGEFDSEIYDFVYNKDNMGGGPEDIGFTKSKELIQTYLSGIKLYRDGFKIGSGREDLFNLGYEQTGGSGGYSLRPSNIAGYIDIRWDKNPKLVDTSNREGLVANAAYKAFYEISMRAISEVNSFRNKSRRLTAEFVAARKNEEYKKPQNYSPELAISDLKQLTLNAEVIYEGIKQQKQVTDKKFEVATISLSEKIKKSNGLFADPEHIKILNELKEHFTELQGLYNSLEPKIAKSAQELASSTIMVNVIDSQIKSYKEQIERFYGHVSIGLSAQFLAHDVSSQIDNITRSNQIIKSRTKFLNVNDIEITKSTMAIDGHTQALSKAVSTLHPLVQAQREEKHAFKINEGIDSYIDYISEYLERDGIHIHLNQNKDDKKISFNRGKYYQVLDNIVRNSQYWLNSYAKHYSDVHKDIYVEVSGYQLTMWDTGKGIRPGIEQSIFDMFVTEKPGGQGLGLFIVKTLLEERNSSIYLLDEENIHRRKYKFRIDFSGAAV